MTLRHWDIQLIFGIVALNVAFEKFYVVVRTPLLTTFITTRYIGFTVAFEEFIWSFRCSLLGWLGVAKESFISGVKKKQLCFH